MKRCVDSIGYGDIWENVHAKLLYLHGRPTLSKPPSRRLSPIEDTITFLEGCSSEHFFDFLELISQSGVGDADGFVDSINEFFDIDALPYFLTKSVYSPVRWIPFGESGHGYNGRELESYSQVISRERAILHDSVIEPTLTLLTNLAFTFANQELLGALADYRKAEYRDCVVKCCSSLESAMKIICDRKGWSYAGNADATALLTNILQRTNLAPFYKSHIQLIPIIRNELSSAHGAGTQPRVIPKHVAHFVINSTASAMLFLVEETNP